MYDEWLQNFYCEKGKNCEPLLVPLQEGSMETLHCDNCGADKKFAPKRIIPGIMSRAPEKQ